MTSNNYRVDGGKVHRFCGRKDAATAWPVYECGLGKAFRDKQSNGPMTCIRCGRAIAARRKDRAND